MRRVLRLILLYFLTVSAQGVHLEQFFSTTYGTFKDPTVKTWVEHLYTLRANTKINKRFR